MNALETLLRPALRLINRQVSMSTPARELCGALEGRIIAVRVRNTGLAMYFRVDRDEIAVSDENDGEPDAAITGSLMTLALLAGRSGEEAVRDGSLELTGDAGVARSFQRLLRFGKPDLEEELAGVIGDAAAHEVGDFTRRLGRWGREAGGTLRQNLSEYLQEESRALPTRYEVDAFGGRVDALRDDVARLDARLKLLETRADDSG
jgi:ubiquinone biosynthesis accessory factor UbiJ